MSSQKKTWIIGLDGASFEILRPIMDAGKLPVLSGLLKNGASGVLRSTVVPFTPQAWASVMTGNNPGKHGVFGFVRQTPGQPPVFLSSKAIKGDKLWSLFSRRGLKSLVVNVPVTFPPEPLNGSMITGMMTPSKQVEFTYPPELKTRIQDTWPDYVIDITSGLNRSRDLSIMDELDAAQETRADLLLSLIKEEEPDFLFAVFVGPDRIQHAFSQFVNPISTAYRSERAEEWRERIYESYAKLDEIIGRLIALGKDANIIFISDHGFTVERGAFYTNDFLVSQGMLALKPSVGLMPARSIIRKLNISALKRFIPNKLIKKTISFTKEGIDWSKTKAYASSVAQQGIYINLIGREPEGIVSRENYDETRDTIIKALDGINEPNSKNNILKAHRREDVFSGPHLESIPDIILDFERSGLESKDSILGGPAVEWSDGGSRGIHHRDGVFLATGPDVRTGEFNGLLLEDIAPNILALAGIKPPDNIDGRVRPDIFKIKGLDKNDQDGVAPEEQVGNRSSK